MPAGSRFQFWWLPRGSTTFTPPVTTPAMATAQAIISVPQAASDTYGAGEMIEVQITFDKAVTVTGTPSIPANLGQSPSGSPEQFLYSRGSGTPELVFVWPVAATDEDTNGIFLYGGQRASDNSIVLNGGTIAAGGVAATLRLPTGGGTQSSAKVDGSLMASMADRFLWGMDEFLWGTDKFTWGT